MENIIIIRNRIMSAYYYAPPQTLLKQPSQLTLPHHSLHRPTLPDRPQDNKHYIHSPLPLMQQQQIVREPSAPHLLEVHTVKYDQQGYMQPKNNPAQAQRNFNQYQLAPEGQLPPGGGYNITSNKLGERIKNKTELHKSNSKNTLALNLAESQHKAGSASIRSTNQSATETGQQSMGKMDATLQALSGEIARLNERLLHQEERVGRLQKLKKEQGVGGNFSSPQMEEIGKILSLVEKAEQRDDYKRAIRMIDDLRGNILDLHGQIKQLQPSHPTEPLSNNLAEIIKDIVAETIKSYEVGASEMREKIEADLASMRADFTGMWRKMGDLELHFSKRKQQQHEHKEHEIITSTKKFEGIMSTLLYEQRITPLSVIPLKNSSKADPSSSDKQNNKTTSLTTRTYYLDSSGYLLDRNRFYLLDGKGEQIRLTERELGLLKKHGLI